MKHENCGQKYQKKIPENQRFPYQTGSSDLYRTDGTGAGWRLADQ